MGSFTSHSSSLINEGQRREGSFLNAISHNAVHFVVCVGFQILASSLFSLFFFNNEAKVKPVKERKKEGNYSLSPTRPRA